MCDASDRIVQRCALHSEGVLSTLEGDSRIPEGLRAVRYHSRSAAVITAGYLSVCSILVVAFLAIKWAQRKRKQRLHTLTAANAAAALEDCLTYAVRTAGAGKRGRRERAVSPGCAAGDPSVCLGAEAPDDDTSEVVYCPFLRGFTREFCSQLLAVDSELETACSYVDTPIPAEFGGYPSWPLFCALSRVLVDWVRLEKFPVKFVCFPELTELDTTDEALPALDALTERVLRWAETLVEDSAPVARRTHTASLLQAFGPKGVLLCLGMRRTRGTVDVPPPAVSLLLRAADAPHAADASSGTGMTRASVAFAKHHSRSADGWWGKLTGNNEAKNKHGEQLILRILDRCQWINVHLLPHEVAVLEVRCWPDGFGARWSADGSYFRGFLEPHFTGGHEARWRH